MKIGFDRNCFGLSCFFSALIGIVIALNSVCHGQQTITNFIVGPFSNNGLQHVLKNGDFECKCMDPWIETLDGFAIPRIEISTNYYFRGTAGLRIATDGVTRWGRSNGVYQDIRVSPRTRYVASSFVLNHQSSGQGGLSVSVFETKAGSSSPSWNEVSRTSTHRPRIGTWQHLSTSFETRPGVTLVRVHVWQMGHRSLDDFVVFDDISLTPESDYLPPTAISQTPVLRLSVAVALSVNGIDGLDYTIEGKDSLSSPWRTVTNFVHREGRSIILPFQQGGEVQIFRARPTP